MKLFLFSTSTIYGSQYLEYCMPHFVNIFSDAEKLLFIPFARPGGLSHDEYTQRAAEAFATKGMVLKGLHSADDPIKAIQEADGVFIGGGNTFVLLSELYRLGLIQLLRERILAGMPYIGTSAGSNIAGQSICTTNDMPIVYPPTFDALQAVPFNLNPHYLDPQPEVKHMGESRETRISEFHSYNETPVIGLREGSWLECTGKEVWIRGGASARLFLQHQEAIEIETGKDVLTYFDK